MCGWAGIGVIATPVRPAPIMPVESSVLLRGRPVGPDSLECTTVVVDTPGRVVMSRTSFSFEVSSRIDAPIGVGIIEPVGTIIMTSALCSSPGVGTNVFTRGDDVETGAPDVVFS